ncbi:hypothetical protein K1719_005490 [Acacia pycnantha]|nr:hypothetical protein K1719_005490 [Acacia pycnantha]
MESQSLNDQFIGDSLEYYDIDIDYGYLNQILNSETIQENNNNNQIDFKFDISNYFDIKELDDLLNNSSNNVEEQAVTVDNPQNNDNNGEGWVKRRKYQRGTVERAVWKQEMKLRNRISARRSIEKKEAYIRELEGKIQRLQAENEFRRRVLEQIIPAKKRIAAQSIQPDGMQSDRPLNLSAAAS